MSKPTQSLWASAAQETDGRIAGCGTPEPRTARRRKSTEAASGSSEVNSQGAPAADMRSFQWRVDRPT
jgi:hypothetical protein